MGLPTLQVGRTPLRRRPPLDRVRSPDRHYQTYRQFPPRHPYFPQPLLRGTSTVRSAWNLLVGHPNRVTSSVLPTWGLPLSPVLAPYPFPSSSSYTRTRVGSSDTTGAFPHRTRPSTTGSTSYRTVARHRWSQISTTSVVTASVGDIATENGTRNGKGLPLGDSGVVLRAPDDDDAQPGVGRVLTGTGDDTPLP